MKYLFYLLASLLLIDLTSCQSLIDYLNSTQASSLTMKKDESTNIFIRKFDESQDILLTAFVTYEDLEKFDLLDKKPNELLGKIEISQSKTKMKCNIHQDFGFCVLPSDQIQNAVYKPKSGPYKGQDSVKFILTCLEEPCRFELEYNNKVHDIVDSQTQIQFQQTEIALLSFYIPAKFERILGVVEFKNRKQPLNFDDIQLEVADQLYKSIIGDQIIFRIDSTNKNSLFCTDCFYNMQVTSDIKSEATVTIFHYYEQSTTINLDKYYFDYSNTEQPAGYNLTVPSYKEYNYLRFKIRYIDEGITGNVFLNGGYAEITDNQAVSNFFTETLQMRDSKPDQFDIKINKEFSLIFKSQESKFFDGKLYHFVAFGMAPSYYYFQVEGISEKIVTVKPNQIIGGGLQNGGLDYYIIETPNLSKQKEKSISYTLAVEKYATSIEAKVIVINSQNNYQTNIPSNSDITPTTEQNLVKYILNSQCGSQKYCYYQVFLSIPNQDSDLFSKHYNIEVTESDDSREIALEENVALDDSLSSNEYKDYYFNFSEIDQSDVKGINIRVSNQDVVLFVSPKSQSCDKARSTCSVYRQGYDLKPVKIVKNSLSKYKEGIAIAVFSQHSVDFTVSVEIIRGDDSENVVLIPSSNHVTSELTQAYQKKHFAYEADLEKDEDLLFNLHCPVNKCMILVNSDEDLPDSDNFTWSSRNNQLKIISKSKKSDFKRKGTYYITVEASIGLFESNSNQRIPFKLMVSGSHEQKKLEFNQPFTDFIAPGQLQYFEFVVDRETIKGTYLSRNILNEETVHADLKFFLGNDRHASLEKFQYGFKGEDEATFDINERVLNALCDDQDYCSIYLAAKNTGKQNLQYTITVWTKQYGIELKEGLQQEYTLFHIDNHMSFYFVPTDKSNDITLSLHSYFGLTNFTVSVFENSQGKHISEWPFPQDNFGIQHITDNELDYVSGIHNSHSITLTSDALKKYKDNTIILISVGYMEDEKQINRSGSTDTDKFIILVSSKFTQINPGHHIQFSLNENTNKFFILPLRNVLATKESAFIQLTSLSGKASIYASIRDAENDRYPAVIEKSDFISTSNYLEITYQEIKNIVDKFKMSTWNNPSLVISIKSWQSSGNFIMGITTNNFNQRDILHGIPQEFHLLPNKQAIFRYYNYFDSDIQIRLLRNYGLLDFAVNSCKKWSSCLSDGEIEFKYATGQTNSMMEIKKDSSKWCKECYIMIQVKNQDFTDLHAFLYVLLDEDTIWLQEGRNMIDNNDKNESNIYRVSAPQNEEVTVSMVIYWGNPEIYISYLYSEDYQEYHYGPYQKKAGSNIIHINVPARESVMDGLAQSQKEQEEEEDDLVLTQNSFYSNLVENEMYIMVRNPEDKKFQSNYTISYYAGNQEKYISDGHIVPFSLQPQENFNFIHEYYDSDAQTVITINLDNFNDFDINKIQVKTQVKEQESRLEEDVEHQEVTLQQLTKSKDHVSYALQKVKGAYYFEIQNLSNKKGNFTLYVNTRDMTLLPLNHKIHHYLVKDSVNYYEVIIPYSGYLSMDLYHCMGLLHLGHSQHYDQFINDKYEFASTEPSIPGINYGDVFQVKKGTFYLALLTTEEEDAMYSLKMQFYKKKEQIPHTKIDLGQDGLLQYDRQDGNIYLEFSPLQCTDCTNDEKTKSRVTYTAQWSTDLEILNTMGKCELTDYFDHNINKLDTLQLHFQEVTPSNLFGSDVKSKSFDFNLDTKTRFNLTFPLQSLKEVYYVSVKAVVHNFPNYNDDIKVQYHTLEIYPTSMYQMAIFEKDLMYVGAFSIIAFISLVFCLILRRMCKKPPARQRYLRQRQQDKSGFQDEPHISQFNNNDSRQEFNDKPQLITTGPAENSYKKASGNGDFNQFDDEEDNVQI